MLRQPASSRSSRPATTTTSPGSAPSAPPGMPRPRSRSPRRPWATGTGRTPTTSPTSRPRGPTPVSLQLKPDVTAPGVDVLSSVPAHDFEVLDGTSMATPHVAGGVALLLQRHPTWTVQQVKSALASTGDEVHPTGRSGEVSVLRAGGGRIDLVRANRPLLFTSPTSVGWGLVRRGFSGTKQLSTTDAGGGNAPWLVSIHAAVDAARREAHAAGEDARRPGHRSLSGSRSRRRRRPVTAPATSY